MSGEIERGLGARRLGRGLTFPPRPRGSGRFGSTGGTDKIRDAVRLILETEPGERVMRPGFGAGLRRYLFEPNNPSTRALIGREVAAALDRWEPRIEVDEVAVTRGGRTTDIDITVRYTIRRTARSDLLVFPLALRS
ncbi:MAG: GPW/gp25 family protein [Acidimicrobiales bacterium]